MKRSKNFADVINGCSLVELVANVRALSGNSQAYLPRGFGRRCFGFGCWRPRPFRRCPAAGAAPHDHGVPVIPAPDILRSRITLWVSIKRETNKFREVVCFTSLNSLRVSKWCVSRVSPAAAVSVVGRPRPVRAGLVLANGVRRRQFATVEEPAGKRCLFEIVRIKESHLILFLTPSHREYSAQQYNTVHFM